jgi:hypothetical protein
MDKTIIALSTLGKCTCVELSKYLGQDVRNVLIDLNFLQGTDRAHCINGYWYAGADPRAKRKGVFHQS